MLSVKYPGLLALVLATALPVGMSPLSAQESAKTSGAEEKKIE